MINLCNKQSCLFLHWLHYLNEELIGFTHLMYCTESKCPTNITAADYLSTYRTQIKISETLCSAHCGSGRLLLTVFGCLTAAFPNPGGKWLFGEAKGVPRTLLTLGEQRYNSGLKDFRLLVCNMYHDRACTYSATRNHKTPFIPGS